jgi:lysophospholipase L1-like esterase
VRRRLAIAFCALVLAAVAAEGVGRVLWPPPPRWRVPQTPALESPLLGWVLAPERDSFTIDVPARTNALGLRDEPLAPKAPGELRVLCLGDSFTFGQGVRFEDTWPELLERCLERAHAGRPIRAVNAGVGGYDTRQELIWVLAEGRTLEADAVVIGFFWNDLLRNEPPLPDVATTPKLLPGAREFPIIVPRGPEWLKAGIKQSVVLYRLARFLDEARQERRHADREDKSVQRALLEGDAVLLEPYWEATAQRLVELADAVRAAGVPAVLAVFPMEAQLVEERPRMVWIEKLRAIWEPTGFALVDLEPAYRASLAGGANPYLPYDKHPSAVGTRIAAGAVCEVLAASGALRADGR